MKLEYKILWLDDYIQDFIDLEAIEEIEKHLTANGFIPNVKTVKKSSDFFAVLDDSYDLILTDFHMNDMNGDKVVEQIRSSKYSVMTEILFYTAKADLKDTQKISRVSFLETNASTDEHIEKVISRTIELIDLTIKKFQHIVTMRGMIMHETSSLDIEMENILIQQIKSSDNSNELILVIKNKYIESNDKFKDEIDQMEDLNQISLKIGASHRWRALKRIIPKGKIKTILNDYENEIISIRNKFAHAVLEKDENGREFFKHKEEGIDFNEKLCKVIRENIIKHKHNLDKIKEELK
jgi:CheY-like chemotaxis protein